MYNKAFKYFPSLDVFNTKKVSANENNSGYTIGNGPEIIGKVDILWENICFIENERLIWTHGCFYNQDSWAPFTDQEILDLMPEDN